MDLDKLKYYHYHYKVKWDGKIIEQDVCYASEKDEQTVTDFVRQDLKDTYDNGEILFFGLTKVTDERGRRI